MAADGELCGLSRVFNCSQLRLARCLITCLPWQEKRNGTNEPAEETIVIWPRLTDSLPADDEELRPTGPTRRRQCADNTSLNCPTAERRLTAHGFYSTAKVHANTQGQREGLLTRPSFNIFGINPTCKPLLKIAMTTQKNR